MSTQDPSIGLPPLMLSPTKTVNFTDVLGTLGFSQQHAFTLTEFLSPPDFDIFSGATKVDGAGGREEINLDDFAGSNYALAVTLVRSGASSVTAFIHNRTDSATANIKVDVISQAIGSDFGTGGTSDTVTVAGSNSNNIARTAISGAFDAAGMITAGNKLWIKISHVTVGATVRIHGLELVWA